jgi:hypothetical protein
MMFNRSKGSKGFNISENDNLQMILRDLSAKMNYKEIINHMRQFEDLPISVSVKKNRGGISETITVQEEYVKPVDVLKYKFRDEPAIMDVIASIEEGEFFSRYEADKYYRITREDYLEEIIECIESNRMPKITSAYKNNQIASC